MTPTTTPIFALTANAPAAIEAILNGPTVERLGWTLVHFVWQGAAVAAVLAAALYLLRRRTADARYLASCASLLLLAAMPVFTFFLVDVRPVDVPAPALAPSPPLATPIS